LLRCDNRAFSDPCKRYDLQVQQVAHVPCPKPAPRLENGIDCRPAKLLRDLQAYVLCPSRGAAVNELGTKGQTPRDVVGSIPYWPGVCPLAPNSFTASPRLATFEENCPQRGHDQI